MVMVSAEMVIMPDEKIYKGNDKIMLVLWNPQKMLDCDHI